MLSPSPSLCLILLSPSPLSVVLPQCFQCAECVTSHLTFMFIRSCYPMPFPPSISSPAPAYFYPSNYISNSLIAHPFLSSFFPSPTFPFDSSSHYLLPLFLPPFGDFTLCCTSPSSLLWYHKHGHIGRVLTIICTFKRLRG